MRKLSRVPEYEYRIRFISLPAGVKAFTSLDETGFANIYVNTALSDAEQRKAVAHELQHVCREDFSNQNGIHAVET